MLIIMRSLVRLIDLLNSEKSPAQLVAGILFGAALGLSPFFTLHNLVLFLIVALFRVNLSMFFLSAAVFKLVGWVLDPAMDALGYALLVNFKAARPLWVYLSSSPIWPYFRFNNTIVIGSLALALLLSPFLIFFSLQGIRTYRTKWRAQIRESRTVKWLKATKFFALYEKVQGLREKASLIQS